MKKLVVVSIVLFLLSITGCAAMGHVASGLGSGLRQSSQQSQPVHCTTSYAGNQGYTSCY